MIYELARDIETTLTRRKFPVPFEYGPERLQRQISESCVVFERDREAGDGIRAPIANKGNPRRRAIRDLGVRVTVFAKSGVPGARTNDHEAECEQIVDALIVALSEWLVECKTGLPLPDFAEARYMHPTEFEGMTAEAWPGVGYILAFRVPRSVDVRDYLSAARPTGSAVTVGGYVEILQTGATGDPEIVDIT